MMSKIHGFLLVVAAVGLVAPHSVEAQTFDNVMCDYGQPTPCVCRSSASECRFDLTIEHIQSFAAYNLETRTRGQVFYIDDNGELRPTLRDSTLPCAGERIEAGICTTPLTVDGLTYRSLIAVNGLVPGPTLIVTEGQRVKVTVHNDLASETTSIHWHGMHQRGTPWMDGVGQITQCPILPSTDFTYIFDATPSGTFWYHSHSGAQRTDGLFGGFIVREKSLPNQYPVAFNDNPEEHTISLLDWQKLASIDLFTIIHSSLRYFDVEDIDSIERVPTRNSELYNATVSVDNVEVGPVPYWSGLINGKGRHKDLIGSNKFILQVFEVERDKSYRFRLIGAQSLYAYRFSIDNHKLTVVATDGYFIEPVYNVDFIIIHSGERYDFVLEANQAPGTDNFWIRAETLEYPSRDNTAEAILHYRGSPQPTPPEYSSITPIERECTAGNKCKAVNCPFESYPDSAYINCINVHQLQLFTATNSDELPTQNPEESQFFNFAFDVDDFTSSINGKNFAFPPIPPILSGEDFDEDSNDYCIVKNGEQSLNDDRSQCIHVVEIDNDKTFQFVFSAVGPSDRRNFSHPIHLHGHSFHVLHVGYGTYMEEDIDGYRYRTLANNSDDLACPGGNKPCSNPRWSGDGSEPFFPINGTTIRKDTVIVPAGGYVVIRFISDNPGFWFLHCHIEVHQLEGMAMVIAEGINEMESLPDELRTCTADSTADSTTDSPADSTTDKGVGVIASTLVILISIALGYFSVF